MKDIVSSGWDSRPCNPVNDIEVMLKQIDEHVGLYPRQFGVVASSREEAEDKFERWLDALDRTIDRFLNENTRNT